MRAEGVYFWARGRKENRVEKSKGALFIELQKVKSDSKT